MISMKNVQFLHTPPSPLFLFVRMDPNWARPPPPPAPGQDLTPSPRPWLKLRLPTTPPPTPNPFTPIPFGILAAYRLYLVDVSIRYHARATQNSLQLKININ